MIQIDQRSPDPIYEQIVQGIMLLILQGDYDKDTKLPSVRELSRDLAINPNTIQRAYNELERNEIIYSRSGIGSFIAIDAQGLKQKQAPAAFLSLDAALNALRKLNVYWQEIDEHILQYKENEQTGGIENAGV